MQDLKGKFILIFVWEGISSLKCMYIVSDYIDCHSHISVKESQISVGGVEVLFLYRLKDPWVPKPRLIEFVEYFVLWCKRDEVRSIYLLCCGRDDINTRIWVRGFGLN